MLTRIGFDHPTFSGRLGFRPNQMWNFGFSASDGALFSAGGRTDFAAGHAASAIIIRPSSARTSPSPGITCKSGRNFTKRVLKRPTLGNADTFAYYLEAKYKFTPQFFGAVRWGQQFFSKVPDRYGGEIPWSQDISRIEGAAGYRFTPHTQLKLEYYLQREDDPGGRCNHTFAAQLTVRF